MSVSNDSGFLLTFGTHCLLKRNARSASSGAFGTRNTYINSIDSAKAILYDEAKHLSKRGILLIHTHIQNLGLSEA